MPALSVLRLTVLHATCAVVGALRTSQAVVAAVEFFACLDATKNTNIFLLRGWTYFFYIQVNKMRYY